MSGAHRFVALGDSFTEGLHDVVGTDGRHRGWADRLAQALAAHHGDLRYANLAVRGRLLDEVVAEQVPVALALGAEVVSFHAGANDVLRPGVDVSAVARRYDDAVATLRASGAEVVLFTVLERAGGTGPLADLLAQRFAGFNEAVRRTAQRHGAVLVDVGEVAALHDRRMWHPDRLHLVAEGHRRVAAAALEALGIDDRRLLGGALGWWRQPLAVSRPRRVVRVASDVGWVVRYLLPWAVRRLRGVSSGDGVVCKRPVLTAIDGVEHVDPPRTPATVAAAGALRPNPHPWSPRGLDRFTGMIAAGAFASGDQVVVGMWRHSPLGRFVDVMWVRPDGERVLLAPSPEVAAFVARLYAFDRVQVVAVRGGWDGIGIEVAAGPLHLRLVAGARDWRSWVFASRPAVMRRAPAWLAVEDRLAGPLGGLLLGGAAGVRVAGVTPGGRREWYSIDDYRTVVAGSLRVGGGDAGSLRDLRPDLGVGLSSFPTRPALVNLVTLIEPAPLVPSSRESAS